MAGFDPTEAGASKGSQNRMFGAKMHGMKRMPAFPTIALAGLGVVLIAGAALAQSGKTAPAPAKPAPVSSEPVSTSASYGDWVLRCQRVDDNDKTPRVCEVAQTIQVQGQQTPIAQIAFGRVMPTDPLKLTVALPPNITIPSSVTVAPGAKDPPVVDMGWRRCVPGGCIADGVPSADALKVFRTASEPGRITFKNAAGADVALPLSFRGLLQALDALNKG